MMKDMKRYGIHTVEQLSQMSDSSISQTNMIGLMSFREKALKHLADQQKSSEYDELKATNAVLHEATGGRWSRGRTTGQLQRGLVRMNRITSEAQAGRARLSK